MDDGKRRVGTRGRARPKVRGDCKNFPRPCPWSNCKHHLATSNPAASCVLDVVDKHPNGLSIQKIEEMWK